MDGLRNKEDNVEDRVLYQFGLDIETEELKETTKVLMDVRFLGLPLRAKRDRHGTDEWIGRGRSHSTPTYKLSATVPQTSFPLVEIEGMRSGRGEGKERLKKDGGESTQSEIKSARGEFRFGISLGQLIDWSLDAGKMSSASSTQLAPLYDNVQGRNAG